MTQDAFITHCTRGVLVAQRGKAVIDPILELLANTIADISAQGDPDDARILAELAQQRRALAEWVADVSELIVDLTRDYEDKA